MGTVRNILFIMADQLRWDYLSYAGHPTLPTPNIDALAARGMASEGERIRLLLGLDPVTARTVREAVDGEQRLGVIE